MFKKGDRFRHYMGKEVELLAVDVRHTETDEDLVIYFDINEPELIWAKPHELFFRLVEVTGGSVARFTVID